MAETIKAGRNVLLGELPTIRQGLLLALFLTKLYGCAVFRSAAIEASHYAALLLLAFLLRGGSSFY